MPPIRLIIADDHALIRIGLRSIIEGGPGFEVVGEACDGYEALELVASLRPDVLLTDIAMPKMNGLIVAQRVAKEFPEVRVIIVSMHTTEEFVGQAVRAGAVGYLLKDANLAEIQLAISTVMRGETYLTPSVSKTVMSSYIQLVEKQSQHTADPLTPRQREILQLIADGQSTKSVARVLDISSKTVETHRSQIMERLGIHDIPGLVRYAMRTGLVPGEKEVFTTNNLNPSEPKTENR